MKTFDEQNAELIAFDKTFDSEDFESCVDRAMLLIRSRQAQMTEEGFKWPIATEACRWRIEQGIINREQSTAMMTAAITYVESIEQRAEDYNGF